MPDYRLFDLKPDGDVALPAEDFFATSDHAAIGYASERRGVHGCELWSRDRFVAVLHPQDVGSAVRVDHI